jgi:hypothetical protein
MVAWSQIGMLGYLIAPTVGGQVVTRLGFGWLGLVPLAAGLAVVVAGLVARGRDGAVAKRPGEDQPARAG